MRTDDGSIARGTYNTLMRVRTTNTGLSRLYNEDLMGDVYDPPGIEFGPPKAEGYRISQEIRKPIAEALVSHYEDIEVHDPSSDDSDEEPSDSGADSDAAADADDDTED